MPKPRNRAPKPKKRPPSITTTLLILAIATICLSEATENPKNNKNENSKKPGYKPNKPHQKPHKSTHLHPETPETITSSSNSCSILHCQSCLPGNPKHCTQCKKGYRLAKCTNDDLTYCEAKASGEVFVLVIVCVVIVLILILALVMTLMVGRQSDGDEELKAGSYARFFRTKRGFKRPKKRQGRILNAGPVRVLSPEEQAKRERLGLGKDLDPISEAASKFEATREYHESLFDRASFGEENKSMNRTRLHPSSLKSQQMVPSHSQVSYMGNTTVIDEEDEDD